MQIVEISINIGLFFFGLLFLVRGSDYLIQASTRLAKSMGVSDLFIGLTIVAIGTSLPEIVSSIAAIIVGKSNLAFANIIGSSLANLTLVVGISAIVAPLATNHIVLDRDTKIMILVVLILGLLIFNPLTFGYISILGSLVLILLLFAYLSFLYWGREECDTCYQFHIFVDFFIRLKFLTSIRSTESVHSSSSVSKKTETDETHETVESQEAISKSLFSKDLLIMVISALSVAFGAQLVITGAEFISTTWGIGESVIGFSLIALSTSLPEISVSINSARHGFGRLLIGNVVGSNIVNISLGLGLASVFIPLQVDIFLAGLLLLFMISVSLVFYYVIRKDWRVTRREGIVLFFLYAMIQGVMLTLAPLLIF
jgi:cation:H+ antiporter